MDVESGGGDGDILGIHGHSGPSADMTAGGNCLNKFYVVHEEEFSQSLVVGSIHESRSDYDQRLDTVCEPDRFSLLKYKAPAG